GALGVFPPEPVTGEVGGGQDGQEGQAQDEEALELAVCHGVASGLGGSGSSGSRHEGEGLGDWQSGSGRGRERRGTKMIAPRGIFRLCWLSPLGTSVKVSGEVCLRVQKSPPQGRPRGDREASAVGG